MSVRLLGRFDEPDPLPVEGGFSGPGGASGGSPPTLGALDGGSSPRGNLTDTNESEDGRPAPPLVSLDDTIPIRPPGFHGLNGAPPIYQTPPQTLGGAAGPVGAMPPAGYRGSTAAPEGVSLPPGAATPKKKPALVRLFSWLFSWLHLPAKPGATVTPGASGPIGGVLAPPTPASSVADAAAAAVQRPGGPGGMTGPGGVPPPEYAPPATLGALDAEEAAPAVVKFQPRPVDPYDLPGATAAMYAGQPIVPQSAPVQAAGSAQWTGPAPVDVPPPGPGGVSGGGKHLGGQTLADLE